ncbi:MAG: gliding motility-associated C-terminal domain-containing protein [Bacteroidia bacterium]
MKHFLRSISLGLIFLSANPFNSGAQTFLNGDFEINTAGTDQINVTNAAFNGFMASTIAYGSYGDMDIIQSATYCGLAENGLWYTALTGSSTDAITMQLSAPLVAGTSYTITFWDRGCWGSFSASAPPVRLAVATAPGTLGTPVYTAPAPVNGTWVMRTATFVAPVSGLYISVDLPSGGLGDWTQIDNFTFVTTTTTPPPVANFAASNTNFCEGTCISFTDMSTNTPTSWSWTFAGGTPGTSTVQNPSSICYPTAGTYAVTLTATNAGGSDTYTQTSYITVNPLQSAAFSYSGSTFCLSGSDPSPTITGTAGGTFTSTPAGLSLNASSGLITLASSTAGTYSVTYTTAGPCSATSTVSVTIATAATANFSYAGPYCANGTDPAPTIAAGSTAGTFSSTAGLSINSASGLVDLSASTPGTYTVTNTIAATASCPAATATATITINAVPVPTITGSNSICSGSNSILTAAGGTTYTWNTGSTTNPITVTPAATTTYTVTASNSGCTATATYTVTVTTPGVATFSYAGPYCQTAANPLPSYSGGGVAGTFSSTAGLVFVNTSTGQINLASSTAGTYTVTNTLPASGPCPPVTATATITINAIPVPVISGPTAVCSGGTITLTASGGTTYNWNTGSGLSSISVSPVITTTYTVTANNGGCTATTTHTVTVTPPPTSTTNATICQGQTYTLPSGAIVSTSGAYSDTASAAGGCDSIVLVNVIVNTATVNASGDVTIQYGDSTHLNSAGGSGFTWSPASGLSCTSCQSPTAGPLSTTTYTVTSTNANGCTASDQVTVFVEMPPCSGALVDLKTLIPNALSPNGDGLNDGLCVPANPCIQSIELTIYDRWGEKVYEGGLDDCWDGKYNGKPLDSAVFAYFFTVKFTDGTKGTGQGNITLLR